MARSSLVRLCVATLVYALTLLDAAAAEHKRVMILHSFGREFRPWNEYVRAIRAELDRQSPWVLDVQEHSLIAARTTDSNPDLPFVEYLHALYADKPPELIICIGAPAAVFIQRHRQKLFPAAPMLFTAVEQRRIQFANLTENDTVVAVRHDFRYLFESFLAIAPETRVIAMVNGNSPNELVWQNEMRRELKPLESRVDIRWYDKLSFEEMLKQIAALPAHSAIFWFQMIIDGAGVGHEGDRALTRLYAVANAPIFTTDQAFFGREIIGGPMHSPAEGGRRTASVAMRILGGEKPGDIKTPPSDFQPPKYDWRELKRWNVSERILPAGSEVDFREPSTWETYRWQIMLICSVVLAQALLITLLVHERGRRLLAEVQSRQRMSELAHVNRFTTANELTASIAHEINQPLGAIRTNAETMELMVKSAAPDIAEIREIVADIRRDEERASEVILRLRSLLKKTPFELREVDLNAIVGETLEFLAALTVGRQVGVDRALEPAPLVVRGDRIQLQQVILNLVVNAIDAMAGMPTAERHIVVRTDRSGNFAEVSIADSGPGIAPDKLSDVFQPFFTTKEHGMGIGLSIARTIVEAHAGQLLAENDAKGGARFRIRLPLA
ncbi:ATPase [Bradyrhizobium manausense]|uniref:sensor histidine kinase n=1 Tax=Bradyrhizobium TaxID=374 RepID=UPI001BADB70A|nr:MULTISPECIES: ATP-binding protein [Bradyrhizobium]MBR0831398.1 ATPase [Bradyrhizobium manausense]UVO27791.1 ATPase [Bradyrhizobium arachidis]